MVSHRRTSQHGQTTLAGVTVVSAALATAAAALSAPPASADPAGRPSTAREAAAARVDSLYAQAERATEKYNGAQARTKELRHEVAALQERTARAQERVNRMRGRLGALAAAQYRSGGVDPTVRLMLSERPDTYLEKASALDRLGSRQADELRGLRAATRSLEQQRRETAQKLTELETSRKAVARHKKDLQRRLATARRLLNALPKGDRAAYDRASRSDGHREAVPDLGGAVPASGRAAAAVAAVRAAVGRPYAWGSSGPSSFDCSGLTQWAYGRAGVSLPRTSQAQRGAGRQVPLGQAQPGDLVIYRSDASHVGMYVGNGQVVHAPYPGARVRYDPVGMMPISSVTRP
ncbi:NlpC/P60 family protein [Streptomyces sp. Je 1-4]|uniref:C40 family peptidase n=1 Tax=Streptomyces TaxID=1883 RepID=UPI0021DAF2FE|nr:MULTISPECIES: C40 family peptidase [unclassified Streptomyces]UYB42878.1 NlpC/P60 family protein [Streptomyces sp. Je 1-4]UZQ39211.1 NlpC/P60 family protein [Streptomyces sp. Je 1-4] [Streptomyces sp. Je 1-4 4N24]UZQ46628.1 NlpC/P60 family protein [Streptomyces sp. Je 1-4] [Streptomyces sp. Je 1-4 4N24_ara]